MSNKDQINHDISYKLTKVTASALYSIERTLVSTLGTL